MNDKKIFWVIVIAALFIIAGELFSVFNPRGVLNSKEILDRIALTEANIRESNSAIATNIAELGGIIKTIDGRVGSIETKIQSIDGRFQLIDRNLQGLGISISGIGTNISGLEKRNAEIISQLRSAGEELQLITISVSDIGTTGEGFSQYLETIREKYNFTDDN